MKNFTKYAQGYTQFDLFKNSELAFELINNFIRIVHQARQVKENAELAGLKSEVQQAWQIFIAKRSDANFKTFAKAFETLYKSIDDSEKFITQDGYEILDTELCFSWSGQWTSGRYFCLNLTKDICRAEWDTATGQESNFLTAIEIIEQTTANV